MNSLSFELACAIPGWMSDGELRWLANRAAEHSRIAEVGCFMGRSTTALTATSGVIFAVDTFTGSEEHAELLDARPDNYLLKEFLRNLDAHIKTGKVRPLRMTSRQAASSLNETNRRFDMVFIDAAHDYGNVAADILSWYPLLDVGGLLCGHDYANGTSGGLERAVNEFLDGFQLVESIWYFTKPEEGRFPPAMSRFNMPPPLVRRVPC